MGRGKTGLQGRPSQLLLLIVRLSVPVIVLTWLAAAWTDALKPGTFTPKSGMRKGAASSFHATHQIPHVRTARRMGPDGRPLPGPRNDDIGTNWSGYAVTGGNYTSAQGTWTVPAVTYVSYPPDPQSREILETSSTWVGIGGDPDPVLIQLGTEQDVTSSGVASYAAWYELYPDPPVAINATQFVVSAGDTITASLQCTAACMPNAQSTWILSMTNGNRWKTPFTIQISNPSTNLASAEWIMEANCAYCGTSTNPGPNDYSYLPDFGSTTFTASSVNNANPNLSRLQNALMVTDPNGKAWAIPSDPVDGNSFTVRFARPGPP